ncbi:bacterial histone-like protein, putative [Plasmodium relictum]|uniref:Bacterial histone-like protein, putative n=1 Tax=Plasmodium relictum TaxID=85471 RepID=A0A1J1H748_PLARL|nr:bacterial histone-like protein, putative [Plasmodium relictum]CRG99254.1 bacterial histone-like protein, putative [Plasmodium relictum]
MYVILYFFFFIFKIVISRRAFINVHKNNIINSKISVSNPYNKNALYQTSSKIPISQAITKKQIIEEVSMETKESKKTVEKIMNGIFDNIYKHLENNEKIYIHKFGMYYNVYRKKRCIKNMRTKEDIHIESSHMPHFKFSKVFKDLIKVNVKVKKDKSDDDENELEEENFHKENINESFKENVNEKLIY